LGWLLFFEIGRAAFLGFFAGKAVGLPLATVLGTFGYGLRLDASAAAYLSIIPFILFTISGLLGSRAALARFVGWYSANLGFLITGLLTVDLGLYHAWGFRLDGTFLQYLASPRELLAAAGSAPLGHLLLVWAGLLLAGVAVYRRLPGRLPAWPPEAGRGRVAWAGVLYLLLLVVPLRGGVQQIPVNQGDVYFSAFPFANHAAVNAAWNFGDALVLRRDESPLLHFMPDSTAQRLVRTLYPADTTTTSVLRERRPNVLFIILESFTAKLVGSVGGDRSQKGLVALLSGYPNQPTTSIMRYPRKTENLPHLSHSLRAAGYSSAFYYGGELAFANMQSYLRAAGYERLLGRADFATRDQNSKWGAHDHVVFDRLLTDLRTQPQPFFVTAFTLSSHEPFDTPIPDHYLGTTEAARFRNSVWYTDWALGRFWRAARRQPWWAHTLVVICADHGHPLPGNSPTEAPARFHVPLVLAGGALRASARGQAIATLGSQTDVATTLLRQLQLPTDAYHWGRNLLAPKALPFAYYCYTDGFGMLGPRGGVVYDNVAGWETQRAPGVPNEQLRLGQAYEQESMRDFSRR
jgi:phosphoglycerol transferase MdoB-like AlkP superfamily enzyme